jgi:hypothetical protein
VETGFPSENATTQEKLEYAFTNNFYHNGAFSRGVSAAPHLRPIPQLTRSQG